MDPPVTAQTIRDEAYRMERRQGTFHSVGIALVLVAGFVLLAQGLILEALLLLLVAAIQTFFLQRWLRARAKAYEKDSPSDNRF
jgi:UPF0716 family protein affecting phage T7 exclusion